MRAAQRPCNPTIAKPVTSMRDSEARANDEKWPSGFLTGFRRIKSLYSHNSHLRWIVHKSTRQAKHNKNTA